MVGLRGPGPDMEASTASPQLLGGLLEASLVRGLLGYWTLLC